ncbi:MAG: hypothetical protein FJW40_21335 [Acidobacteria bacterium]|nr:hypothetical protein [Acidobacteriota bacterium]
MSALHGEWQSCFRLRCGDHRVIFRRIEDGLEIIAVGHRSEIYKKPLSQGLSGTTQTSMTTKTPPPRGPARLQGSYFGRSSFSALGEGFTTR